MYGIEYQDQTREGNIWEFGKELGLSIVVKNTVVKNNPKNKLYFGGVQIVSLDKYVSMAVNDYGWTIVIYSQNKDQITGRITREFDTIISPGTNTLTTYETNNLLVIYLENVSSLIHKNTNTLYAGVSYIDTVSGESGTIQYPFKEHVNESIIFDELIKIITIKNPSDIVIYCDKLDYTEKDLIDKLHITYYNHKIHINKTPKELISRSHQENLFNNIYSKGHNTNQIFRKLGIDHYLHCRISLTIMLEFIIKRNKSILEKIKYPKLMFNESDNLILANNSLEQLNIVNNIKRNYYFQKKHSLLDLLDYTKTLIGKRLFRSRLMNPITNSKILENRYNNIDNYILVNPEITNLVKTYLKDLIDIQNTLCKLKRKTFKYNDIIPFYNSINIIIELLAIIQKTDLKNIIPSNLKTEKIFELKVLIEETFNLEYLKNEQIYNYEIEKSIFNLNQNKKLDNLQIFINTDRNLINELIIVLTKIIDKDFYHKLNAKTKGKTNNQKETNTESPGLINKGKNAQYNHYIYTTPARAETLKKVFSKSGFNLTMGQYKLKKEDFKFNVISKGKVKIDLECINSSSNNLIRNVEELKRVSKTFFLEIIDKIVSSSSDMIEVLVDFIGELDFIQSCALVADKFGYSRPIIDNQIDNQINNQSSSFINVKGIRHPIIEQLNQNIPYISNDIELGTENKNGILLFGVNAVGKSSLMKSIGCNVIMAQAGMFVSADKFIYKPFNYLFTRICGNDNIFAGMSTFEVEMEEFKIIMNYADKNSIILGDEICSGTETLDATAIVASGINILSKRKANFLFATHLHYLAKSKYISNLDNVSCKHMSVIYNQKDQKLIYERKLQDGSGPSSYGIEVCKSMNMNTEFMEMSQKIRDELDDNSQLILGKQSKYNKNKIISKCEVCSDLAVDTHHIKFQCSADNKGMIDHWHKDNKFNLVGLCKKCHNDVHSSPPRLLIEGYQQTSKGIELIYKFINDNDNTNDNNDNTNDNTNDNNANNTNKIKNNNKDIQDLKEKISSYKKQNLTIRQIQYRLKKEGIVMTQKVINSYL